MKTAQVRDLRELDRMDAATAGGKAANLGEVAGLEGVRVPEGFCLTVEVYQDVVAQAPGLQDLLDRLTQLRGEDRNEIGALSREIRRRIENVSIPEVLCAAIAHQLARLGEDAAYAVRSSATAEDLPTASFAGQYDTSLDVVGEAAILDQIRRCWASLFTERAIAYRLQNGFDQRAVQLAVLVQKMVHPQSAGVLFTADPVTSHRGVVSIEAVHGLGDALVSGRANADVYRVQDGKINERRAAGATVLTDAQILDLERLGRRLEAHFGRPQDIEWCLADGTLYVLQSRPITTLYPVPEVHDQAYHVYVSVGHQQMMTDAMKPLGWSFFQLTAARPMFEAGGRLFVDIAQDLTSPSWRHVVLNVLGKSDPLVRDALLTLLERVEFPIQEGADAATPSRLVPAPDYATQEGYLDIVAKLIRGSEAATEAARHAIQSKSGTALLDFIVEDLERVKQILLDRQSAAVVMAGISAAGWLNEKMETWLGEKNAADALSQSVPNNVTSQMGLALLDVADAIRPYPDVVAYLEQAKDDTFFDGLLRVNGGSAAKDAIAAFLAKYGMRGVGEIDLTRPRWRETPTTLVPLILGNLKHLEPGASRRKFEQGRLEAERKAASLLARLRQLPDGEQKAEETERMIRVLRDTIGYREYPKYRLIARYFVYREALQKEARRLVEAGVLREADEMDFLTFPELREVVRTGRLDPELVRARRATHQANTKLTPPRVFTSDGEIIRGAYKHEHLPPGAIAGIAVSSGVVEGRARVVSRLEDAKLEPGDILVTAFTDPSWTPVFVAIRGLVTEVGGLMTHGAVIAREYGLPAVVGVEHATTRIRDGQRIRVNGTEGVVEIL